VGFLLALTLYYYVKRVEKGWGYELWIVNKSLYCGKLLYFEKGKSCSWHVHKIKDETFFLHSGSLLLRYGDSDSRDEAKEIILRPKDSFYIYPGLRHQMTALEDSELYEFSTEHFEEDSYRIIKGD
jgi:mannose-6-phosphate isomerase-like protein (cupin superfamily)